MTKEIKRLILVLFLTFAFLFGQCGGGGDSSSGGENEQQPSPSPPPSQNQSTKQLADLSLSINPAQLIVSLDVQLSQDVQEVGEIEVILSPYDTINLGYLFINQTVFIFPELKGTNLKSDLYSVRLQITDFGSDKVVPRDVVIISPTLTEWLGINLISGFDENGLPYYDYGDFYATDRALLLKGEPSSFQWCLAFDFDGLNEPFTIKAVITAKLPQPDDENANIVSEPYLNNLTSSSVTILWETDKESRSIVCYGKTPQQLNNCVDGKIARYQIQQLLPIGSPPKFNSFLHKVKLTELEPETTYYYQVISASSPSQIYSFKTLAEREKTFRFAIIGDTRTNNYVHEQLINLMKDFQFDFYIHLGDLTDSFSSYDERKTFLSIEQPLLSYLPIFPVYGNHEDVVWYKEYFELPKNSTSPELDELCYSFEYQGVYFIFIDNINFDLEQGTTVYNWLESELSNAWQDPNRKFTFIFSHSPFFGGYDHFWTNYQFSQLSFLGPLFQQYDVNAGFAGHIHLYERLDAGGMPYFISGGGGAPFYAYGIPPYQFLLDQQSNYAGFTISDQFHTWKNHFLLVEVGSNYFQVSAYDDSGSLFDSLIYYK